MGRGLSSNTMVLAKICNILSLFSTSVQFSQVFQSANSFAATPFADPHWNSYLDLTGDCRSDVVIVDQNKNI